MWQKQRERKVQEQHQQAAAGAPPACARLGNALDLPLFTAGDNSLSWLAHVLGWARAFMWGAAFHPFKRTLTRTPHSLAGLRVSEPCASG